MPRIRHIGGHSSILTAKTGAVASFIGTAWTPVELQPTFNVGAIVASPLGLFFRPDGLRFYVVKASDDTIHEFRMSKKWRIDSAVYFGSAVIPSLGSGNGLAFKPDGTALYVSDRTASAAVRQYSLSTAWDISTLSFVGAKTVSTEDTAPGGIAFKPDGTKMFVVGTTGVDVNEYTLSTPWLASTATFVSNNIGLSAGNSVAIKPDGTRMFYDRPTGNEIVDLALGTAWTLAGTNTLNTTRRIINSPRFLFFRDDGLAFYNLDINSILTQYGAT